MKAVVQDLTCLAGWGHQSQTGPPQSAETGPVVFHPQSQSPLQQELLRGWIGVSYFAAPGFPGFLMHLKAPELVNQGPAAVERAPAWIRVLTGSLYGRKDLVARESRQVARSKPGLSSPGVIAGWLLTRERLPDLLATVAISELVHAHSQPELLARTQGVRQLFGWDRS